MAISGIVFSFNGFQSPVNLAGEARNPGRSVPFAVIGSILLATIVYLLLQVAFLGAVDPAQLAKGGWASLAYSSPFAQLALALNLNWLALLLYSDAFISPSGTGATYTATTARMIYGMERNGTLPKVFGKVHPRWGIPRPAMWLNLVVAFIFLFFFRGWATLAEVISVATIISYLTGPVSVSVLRRTAPELHRPLRVPGLMIVAACAFVFSTELLYWARWPRTGEIILLMVVALPIWLYYTLKRGRLHIAAQLRGVDASAWALRPDLKIVEGRKFKPGMRELVVGEAAKRQFAGLDVGKDIKLGTQVWKVVGVFQRDGAWNSELWSDRQTVASAYRRGNSAESVLVKLTSPSAFGKFKATLAADPRLKVEASTTHDYFAKQSEGLSKIIRVVGLTVGIIMAIGALFGALNCMFAAVASRAREIATLRAIGFRGAPVVVSVMLETMLLALAGGVLGALRPDLDRAEVGARNRLRRRLVPGRARRALAGDDGVAGAVRFLSRRIARANRRRAKA